MNDVRKNRGRALDLEITVRCAVCSCDEPVVTAEDHHKTPRAFGGTDDAGNRVWLCGACHGRLHRVQQFLVKGKTKSAYDICAKIFPRDGKARGALWELSNKAASAEREMGEVFSQLSPTISVQIKMERDTWQIVKALAKERKTSASSLAAAMIENAVAKA